jgi:hypothetical protein
MKKLNEDPDVVGGYNREVEGDPYASTALKGSREPTYGDDDSVTFALFNNFNLYSFDSSATHGDLYQNFTPYKNQQVYVQNSGVLSEKDKNKINHVIAIDGTDRAAFLRQMPEVIQGRLWTDSRIISFWNNVAQISVRKNDIIDFIKMDIKLRPEKFQYEIRNVLYSYDDFLSGRYKDVTPHVFPKFDPGAIHTLSPDKKAEFLKSMGAVPKTPIPLADKQRIQGESFRSWLGKVEST